MPVVAAAITTLVIALLAAPPLAAADLRLATWNLEWLVSPDTAHAGRRACDTGRRATLPCDVARRLLRDSADHARLAAYARALDADVVALQEVENEAIAARVFRGYSFCLAAGPGVQRVGFAIRREVAHRCEAPYEELTLGSGHRPGAVLTLWPQEPAHSVILLAVHLKSGCASDPAGSARAACRVLQAQMDALRRWLDARSKGHGRIAILGDFNRPGPDAADPYWQPLLEHAALPLASAAADAPFRNCHAGQPFWQPIDHILVTPQLADLLRRGSFRKHGYTSADALNYRLSDHCPVSINLLRRE